MAGTTEAPETRLKRLAMRSMRRGTKEMDLILGGFAAAELDRMSDTELDDFEILLSENDQDLYQWITGQKPPPPRLGRMSKRIRLHRGLI